jgi:hypothetical protein
VTRFVAGGVCAGAVMPISCGAFVALRTTLV